ncbi:hypothetical protein [Enterococcus sp. CSURQ0835]|uniref:hypothetical protein n=1 Tax=Enterococcus sp. CSURQ0835 TaxID=2681394 RepID=UPI00135C47CB|nr:hypothetical protein [Enterococcus sp. CSURQ0835]
MKPKPEKRKKNLIRLFSDSSYRLLSEFLTDSPNRKIEEQKRKNQTMIDQLKLAALKDSLVVLQIQPQRDVLKFETISGWLSIKTITENSVMVRTPEDRLLMIKVETIKKMTSLAPDGKRKSISR